MDVNAVRDVVAIPAAAEACERPAEGMARHAGHDVDLVARVHPRAAVLERPIRRRVHFRRKVVREKEDSHGSVRLQGP